MNKSAISKEENKYSKTATIIFVIFCSIIGGVLGIELVVSFLECVSAIINALNIAIKFDLCGIYVNTFFQEVILSSDTWLRLFISSTFIFFGIFTTIAVKYRSK